MPDLELVLRIKRGKARVDAKVKADGCNDVGWRARALAVVLYSKLLEVESRIERESRDAVR